MVSTQSLARHAEQLRLGDHLILGRGEEKTGGRFKQALLADAYEALIAAIYLDGGLDAAEAFLRRELKDALDDGSEQTFVRRPQVSAAGTSAGARPSAARVSRLGRSGPRPSEDLQRRSGRERRSPWRCDGRAKKEAEQEAARLALSKLE